VTGAGTPAGAVVAAATAGVVGYGVGGASDPGRVHGHECGGTGTQGQAWTFAVAARIASLRRCKEPGSLPRSVTHSKSSAASVVQLSRAFRMNSTEVVCLKHTVVYAELLLGPRVGFTTLILEGCKWQSIAN